MAIDTGFGTTLTWGTSSFEAELFELTPPGASRESIDTSHMSTESGAKTFIEADLVDWGEATFSIAFDPGEMPPIYAPPETITITFPDATTWAFSGFVTGYEPTVPMEDKMTADLTVKVTGRVDNS